MNKHPIIALSGISGSGKTTIGRILAKEIGGIFIDQDWYFKKKKPFIRLSNGETVPNYDTDAAIDIKKMNENIRNKFVLNLPIIIAGFALREYFFDRDTKPDIHFHIRIPKQLSLETRLKVKKFSDKAKKNEIYMFNEVVFPYYLQTLEKSKIDYFINGTNEDGVRRNMGAMVSEILNHLKVNAIVPRLR